MHVQLTQEVIELITAADSSKVLATIDEQGVPHVTIEQSLHVGDDGNLHYLEPLETSRANRNLVGSIWFDRTVAIAIRGKDGRIFQIKGKPLKAVITGELFQRHYSALREQHGDVDLAAVWIIEPQEVTEETFVTLQTNEEAQRPFFRHLDRLAKPHQEGILS